MHHRRLNLMRRVQCNHPTRPRILLTIHIISIASYQYSKFVGRGTTYNTPHAYTGPVLIVNSSRPHHFIELCKSSPNVAVETYWSKCLNRDALLGLSKIARKHMAIQHHPIVLTCQDLWSYKRTSR